MSSVAERRHKLKLLRAILQKKDTDKNCCAQCFRKKTRIKIAARSVSERRQIKFVARDFAERGHGLKWLRAILQLVRTSYRTGVHNASVDNKI